MASITKLSQFQDQSEQFFSDHYGGLKIMTVLISILAIVFLLGSGILLILLGDEAMNSINSNIMGNPKLTIAIVGIILGCLFLVLKYVITAFVDKIYLQYKTLEILDNKD